MTRLVCFSLLVCVAACNAPNRTDPVTGKEFYSPVAGDYASQDRNIRARFIMETRLANEGGLLPEPAIQSACQDVFDRVAAAVPPEHRRGFQYHFVLTAAPDVNAYTYGGGRVHCHLGLLARCRDEAEFASVVAHEIGHNSHDHVSQGIGRQERAVSILNFGRGIPGQGVLARVGGLIASVALVQHTREEEREADQRAIEYLFAAGYDPDGAARFFEAMERDFGGRGAQFLQTHPFPRNRVKTIRATIAARGGAPAGSMRSSPAFDAAVRRARVILPYYDSLYGALGGDDIAAVHAAADKGIAALPNHAAFHFWKGLATDASKEPKAALGAVRRAAALDDTNVLIPLVHGAMELSAHNYPRAEGAASNAIRIIPALPAPYLVRGVARLGLGRKSEAFGDFDRAVSLLPEGDRRQLVDAIREQVPEYEYKKG